MEVYLSQVHPSFALGNPYTFQVLGEYSVGRRFLFIIHYLGFYFSYERLIHNLYNIKDSIRKAVPSHTVVQLKSYFKLLRMCLVLFMVFGQESTANRYFSSILAPTIVIWMYIKSSQSYMIVHHMNINRLNVSRVNNQ